MPLITFVKAVPNEAGGLLYGAGYSADVSEKTAQKWVRSGFAVIGALPAVEAAPEPVEAPEAEEASFKFSRRRSGLAQSEEAESDA